MDSGSLHQAMRGVASAVAAHAPEGTWADLLARQARTLRRLRDQNTALLAQAEYWRGEAERRGR